jgi:hypothetical protein
MKLDFVYSSVYFRNLNKYHPIERSWEDVLRIGKQFEKEYELELNNMLKIIPEVMNASWKRDFTQVYFMDWAGPSFSHPLTLKVREDTLLMLVILIHELLHQFYTENFNLDKHRIEEEIDSKVKEVLERLGISAEEQLKTLAGFHVKHSLN